MHPYVDIHWSFLVQGICQLLKMPRFGMVHQCLNNGNAMSLTPQLLHCPPTPTVTRLRRDFARQGFCVRNRHILLPWSHGLKMFELTYLWKTIPFFGTLRVPAWSAQVLLGIKILVSTLAQVLGTSTIQGDPHFHNKSAIISKKLWGFHIFHWDFFWAFKMCFFPGSNIRYIRWEQHGSSNFSPCLDSPATFDYRGKTLRSMAWVKVGHPEMVYSVTGTFYVWIYPAINFAKIPCVIFKSMKCWIFYLPVT